MNIYTRVELKPNFQSMYIVLLRICIKKSQNIYDKNSNIFNFHIFGLICRPLP